MTHLHSSPLGIASRTVWVQEHHSHTHTQSGSASTRWGGQGSQEWSAAELGVHSRAEETFFFPPTQGATPPSSSWMAGSAVGRGCGSAPASEEDRLYQPAVPYQVADRFVLSIREARNGWCRGIGRLVADGRLDLAMAHHCM